jgi:hypothetical protein
VGASTLVTRNVAPTMKLCDMTGTKQKNFSNYRQDLSVKLTFAAVLPERQQRHIEANVTDARIRSEYGDESRQNGGQHDGLVFQLQRQREQVQNCSVDLKRVEEQRPEVLEHFGEEVPEQTDVGLQVSIIDSEDGLNLIAFLHGFATKTYMKPSVESKNFQSLAIKNDT